LLQKEKPMLAERIAALPRISTLAPPQARLVGAIRSWVVAHRLRQSPSGALKSRLGSARAAAHLEMLLAEIACAWPDPFAVAPPCCSCLSHDEALVAEMFGLAEAQDQPAFDRLLADLLPADERERLFLSMRVLSAVLD
jgi:hypothetical protein